MAKNPAFLFYPGDFLTGVLFMDLEQRGAYITLLCVQFENGSFTEKQAMKVCETSEIWNAIKTKFTEDSGVFYNERLKEEADKRAKFCESRRNNRCKNTSKTYVKHMENENENINEDVIEEVIDYLNNASNSKFRSSTSTTSSLINARLNEYSKQDLIDVIDLKVHQWLNDSTMNKYLRPSTLFNATKFESYIQEVNSIKDGTTPIDQTGSAKVATW